MAIEFQTLNEYHLKLRERFFFAICAFKVFEALEESRTTTKVGAEEAEKNVRVMGNFKYLFQVLRESARISFLLELAKLFDDADQSLHLNKLINYSAGNMGRLSKDEFLKFHQNRQFVEELFEQYQSINHRDLEEIRERLREHQTTIKKIITYRDENLAHNDRNKTEIEFHDGEIEVIFKLLAEVLDIFSSRLAFSSTYYGMAEDDAKWDVVRALDYLARFEPYRLKEIEDMYKDLH